MPNDPLIGRIVKRVPKPAGTVGGGLPPPPTAGNLIIGQGTTFASKVVSGDATLAASGVLTLDTVNANVGTFGDSTHVGQFTVNAKGLITAASSVAISDVDTATTVTTPVFFAEEGGDESLLIPGPPGPAGATGATGATGSSGAGTMGPPGLDGEDGDSLLVGRPQDAPNGVVAGTYGDATHVGSFTVDQYGDVTAASSVLISQSPVTGGGPTDPLNFWWMAEPANTGATGFTNVPVTGTGGNGGTSASPGVTANNNPTLAAFSDTTGLYVAVTNNTGAANANASVTNSASLTEFQQLPRVTIKMKTGADVSSLRLWGVLTTGTFPISGATFATDTLGSGAAFSGAGFRYSTAAGDTTWHTQTFNGTTQTTADSGVTVSANTRYDLVIDFAAYPTNVKFYINGTLVRTETATLPGTGSATCGCALSLNSLSGGGTARTFRLAKFHVVGQT